MVVNPLLCFSYNPFALKTNPNHVSLKSRVLASFFSSSLFFGKYLWCVFLVFFLLIFRPDITAMVDWA